MIPELRRLLFVRRDKLWISMEYCGGGSLQDIYHSKDSLAKVLFC